MREQVVEGAAEWHGVNHDWCPVGELQPDDLEEAASLVRSDRQDSRWVGVRFEVDDNEGVTDRVDDGIVTDSVLAGRVVYFHTALSYYEGIRLSNGPEPCESASGHQGAGLSGGRSGMEPLAP